MPHDMNGIELHPGDIVSIRFKVKQITNTEDFCNLTLETELPMTPHGIDRVLLSQINSKQTEKLK